MRKQRRGEEEGGEKCVCMKVVGGVEDSVCVIMRKVRSDIHGRRPTYLRPLSSLAVFLVFLAVFVLVTVLLCFLVLLAVFWLSW